MIERYESLKAMVKERRPEFDKLCDFAENETEYLTAPASSRFHLCKESGLLEHSLNVAETMLKMKNTLAPEISDDSCIVTALFHDLGKAGMPNSPLYIKNISKKNKEPSVPYSVNNDMTYLSVPVRSLYLIMDGDGELRLSLMATLAQEESRKVSDRVKAGQAISRQNGTLYGCGNILGYDLKSNIGEDGKWNPSENTYVVNPEQAETVRMIFDLYEQGNGCMKIANILTERHRKNATGNVRWGYGNLIRIIANATYKGMVCYNKSRSNNYLEQKRNGCGRRCR